MTEINKVTGLQTLANGFQIVLINYSYKAGTDSAFPAAALLFIDENPSQSQRV